ncbi:hypothetical protein NDA13_001492 [Ustilago tritici]|nr:hypothetical protein NDA13_001492 [Ustilago tritici]
MASITDQRCQQILQLCLHILECGRASLLELQQVVGHLQLVTRVVPHGCAFLHRLYDAIKVHYKVPFGQRLNKAARDELSWWTSALAVCFKLSELAAFLLWNGLAASTQSRSTTLCIDFVKFTSNTLQLSNPLPASTDTLVKWAGHLHSASKPYQTVKCNLAVLKSWHIDLGHSTTAFDTARLAQAL